MTDNVQKFDVEVDGKIVSVIIDFDKLNDSLEKAYFKRDLLNTIYYTIFSIIAAFISICFVAIKYGLV